MPIGVPRIIYCWSDELPVQWTDIYNFIFRRRMVFLMQYLDDELCNQIVGLLINIHMEDRTAELENKNMDKMGLFSRGSKAKLRKETNMQTDSTSKKKSIEDLLKAEDDLSIDESYKLEQMTLQKITMEWLNWNAQFFDYQDEPYIFYLAEILSKSFNETKQDARLFYSNWNKYSTLGPWGMKPTWHETKKSSLQPFFGQERSHFDIYSPFRIFSGITSDDFNFSTGLGREDGLNLPNKSSLFDISQGQHYEPMFPAQRTQPLAPLGCVSKRKKSSQNSINFIEKLKKTDNVVNNNKKNLTDFTSLLSNLANYELWEKIKEPTNQIKTSEKVYTQRNLKKQIDLNNNLYTFDNLSKFGYNSKDSNQALNLINPTIRQLLDFDSIEQNDSFLNKEMTNKNFNQYNKEQTERFFQEEESKKVFMLINSFGGSVGNGITIHDALQYIKAGSLTLALGVAASAASLALAGGTIGERYVTEGCHTMIHQPESAFSGQASDIWIDSQEILKIRQEVANIYSLSTYRPRHKILRDLDRDFYLTASETIYYGLADDIASNVVMHEIIEMTNKAWDSHESRQQRLLESREKLTYGNDAATETQ
jgi:ATP-dependent Clp protease protease subunit